VGLSGSIAALLLGLLAAAGPTAAVVSEDQIDPAFDQGLTRSPTGWIVSGRDVLARLSDDLTVEQRQDGAIPAAWRQRGFDHIGDVDLSGTTLYVPFEQPDYEQGRQAMARYDGRTLEFRDATIVDQHENSFVAVDGDTGIAYSMDRFGGAALLRYDVRANWRRLPPLPLDRSLERVQGASVARGAVWLSTDDGRNGLYRVDIDTGEVSDLGPAPPVGGEGEGIDATDVRGDNLHATVVTPDRTVVSLDHFEVTGEPEPEVATPPTQDASPGTRSDTSWPPALVYFAVGLMVVALGAVGTVFWRARTTIRPKN
jgi:hypothetical protein